MLKVNLAKLDERYAFAIPIINTIADNTSDYFELGGLGSTGGIRGLLSLLFLLRFILHKYPRGGSNILTLVYLIYIFVLCLLSSNPASSLNFFLKFFISSMMLPVGYYYIKDFSKLRSLTKSVIISIGLVLFFILIANIFKLGSTGYARDSSFYYGAGHINITKDLAVMVVCSTIVFQYKEKLKYPKVFGFLLVAAIVIIGITLKRTAVATVAAGIIFYIVYSPSRTKSIGYLLVGIVALVLAYPLYGDQLSQSLAQREGRLNLNNEENLEEEARLQESDQVIYEFIHGDLGHQLFGSEIFNDREYFNVQRMMHMDYSILLHGSGAVGVIFYLAIMGSIVLTFMKHTALVRLRDQRLIHLKGIFWSLVIAFLLMGISNSVYVIGLRSLLFIYFGAILRLLEENKKGTLSPIIEQNQSTDGSFKPINGSTANISHLPA